MIFIKITSTWFFIGYIPFAQGTFGTICALPIAFAILSKNVSIQLASVFAFVFWASIISSKAEEIYGKDAPEIVIDEVAGYLVAVCCGSPSVPWLALNFVLFRIFDILKPYPISKLEGRSGVFVVLDDVLAGFFSNVLTRILLEVLSTFFGLSLRVF